MLVERKWFWIPASWLKLDNYFRKIWTEHKGEDPIVSDSDWAMIKVFAVVSTIVGAIFYIFAGMSFWNELWESGPVLRLYLACTIFWAFCVLLLWVAPRICVNWYKDFCVELTAFARLLGFTSLDDVEKLTQMSLGPLKRIVWDRLTEFQALLLQEQQKLADQAADADVQQIRLKISEYDSKFEDLLRRAIFWKLQENGKRGGIQDAAWAKLRTWERQKEEEAAPKDQQPTVQQ